MSEQELLTEGGTGALAAFVVMGVNMLWKRFISTEGKANDRLVDQLSERISVQEERMKALEARFDEERRMRLDAESKVSALQMRVMRLEFELKHHGIEVPPDAS